MKSIALKNWSLLVLIIGLNLILLLVAHVDYKFSIIKPHLSDEYCKCKPIDSNNLIKITNESKFDDENNLRSLALLYYLNQNSKMVIYCSASILNPNWALTAGYCARADYLGKYEIYLGAGLDHHAVDIHKSDHNHIGVKRFHTYPGYYNLKNKNTNRTTVSDENDLALVELESSFLFDEETKIEPACLLDIDLNDELISDQVEFIAAGYDSRNSSKTFEKGSAHISILKPKRCNFIENSINGSNIISRIPELVPSEDHFCVSSKQSGICKLNTGGPLYYASNHRLYVAGIARVIDRIDSGSCAANSTNIYTNVYSKLNWIKRKITGELCSTKKIDLNRRPSYVYIFTFLYAVLMTSFTLFSILLIRLKN